MPFHDLSQDLFHGHHPQPDLQYGGRYPARAVGDSKRPLYFLIASCYGQHPAGRASGGRPAVSGWPEPPLPPSRHSCLSACPGSVWTLIQTEDTYKLEWSRGHGSTERMLRRIVRIGIPAGNAVRYVQYLQYYHPGRREHTGNRQCDGLGHLRKGGRPVTG